MRVEQFPKIPLLLPHEVVGTVQRKNVTNEAILARTSFDTMDIEYMAGLEGKVGATPGSVLGLSPCGSTEWPPDGTEQNPSTPWC